MIFSGLNMELNFLFILFPFIFFVCRNRFKSYDVCLGFCETAKNQFQPSIGNENGDKSISSFVTEPPLGPRPDLLEPFEETEVEYEEYDEARCEVSLFLRH